MSINKKEFVERYSMNVGVTRTEGAKQVEAFLNTLEDSIKEEGGVLFVGHLSFKKFLSKGRTGSINGVPYTTESRHTVKLSIGKEFHDKLNS